MSKLLYLDCSFKLVVYIYVYIFLIYFNCMKYIIVYWWMNDFLVMYIKNDIFKTKLLVKFI